MVVPIKNIYVPLLRTFERKHHPYGVFLMNNDSENQQSLFLESFYRSYGVRAELDRTWFKWFYTQCPLGYCNNYVLLDLANDQWIGAFGFAKKPYCAEGVTVVGGHGVNGFVNPGYEGLGLYTELIAVGLDEEDYSERLAFSFPYSRNVASIKGHWKSGWQSSVSLTWLEKRTSAGGKDDAQVSYSSKAKGMEEIDFERFEAKSGLSFPRDHSEFSWRYPDRPDRQYRYLTLNSNDEMGYMILADYETKDGTRRCETADYRFSSPEVLDRLIARAEVISAEEQYQILDVLINPSSPAHVNFRNRGFTPRDEGYELLTYGRTPLVVPQDIAVCYGDFDVV